MLLLAGSVEGAKRQVYEYLETFLQYEWLWKDNKEMRALIREAKAAEQARLRAEAKKAKAAEPARLTAEEAKEFGVVDEVVAARERPGKPSDEDEEPA